MPRRITIQYFSLPNYIIVYKKKPSSCNYGNSRDNMIKGVYEDIRLRSKFLSFISQNILSQFLRIVFIINCSTEILKIAARTHRDDIQCKMYI